MTQQTQTGLDFLFQTQTKAIWFDRRELDQILWVYGQAGRPKANAATTRSAPSGDHAAFCMFKRAVRSADLDRREMAGARAQAGRICPHQRDRPDPEARPRARPRCSRFFDKKRFQVVD